MIIEADAIDIAIDNNIDVTSTGSIDVETADLSDLDITVAKKEYSIVGDDIYIPVLYDDAPQWMKDLVQLVVDTSMEANSTDLLNEMIAALSVFATSYVPLNQYTQSIIDLGDEDTRINGIITTLNSNLSDGLTNANAQIIELQLTKASKTEVVAKIVQTLSAQLADRNSVLGATVGRLDQAIADETSARAKSLDAVMASLDDTELAVTANASATTLLRAYVGIDPSGGLTGTGLLADIEILQKQNDGVIETIVNTYDVMLNPQDPSLAELVLTAEPYATWKAADVTGMDTRLAHVGDVYIKTDINNGYLESYKFIRTVVDNSDAHHSTDADGFTWALVVDQASQNAYAKALQAFDLADGKRRTFVATPIPPYDIGDIWLVQSGATIIGTTQGGRVIQAGDMLRCAEDKVYNAVAVDKGYEHGDWVPADNYRESMNAIQADLNSWRTGAYSTFVENIQNQVDGKSSTFYRSSVPPGRDTLVNVAYNATLSSYVGDLWKNTNTGSVEGYEGKNTEYVYTETANGSNWDYGWAKMEVPDIVFDTIDTKKSIYSGNTLPTAVAPAVIENNDMWITGDAPVSPYLAKSIYIWNSTEAEWMIPVGYTDDQYARSIVDGTAQIDLSQHINSLGWTDDSTVDDFIVGTYAKDLLNIGNQVDGVAVTYFQNDAPYLASAGTSANSGDVWYDTNAATPTAYKFKYKTLGPDGVTVVTPSEWTIITNAFVLSSLTAASKTKAAADRSIKNYTSTPVTPYYKGDTWMQGSTGDIYVCNAERLTGAFNQSDWIIASKYTNDSRVIQLETGITNGSIAFNLNSAVVGGKPLTAYVADEIDKEVVVYSGTNHLDYSSLGSLKPNDLYIEKTTATGASGVAVDVLNTWKCLTVSPTTGIVTSATWSQIGNNNNITALADLADGKRTVFSGSVVPAGAVARDIWIPSADVAIATSAMCTVAGGTWNGTVCNITKYLSGEIYQFSSAGKWLLATKYSANLESVRSSLQNQVDGKIMTTYGGATPPIANQTVFGPKSANRDDYWYCDTNGEYEKGKVYKYEETEGTGADLGKFKYTWKFSSDISREAFDLADGKSAIFTTENQPSAYSKNDMMIVVGTFNNGTTVFSDGVVLTATVDSTSFVAAHWVKKINDTEDLDAYKKVVDPKLTSLENQVDSKVESWYKVSTDDPKSAWTDATTRAKHDGDMWYQTDTKLSYYYSSSSNSWNLIDDAKAILALSNAATAQATADGVVVSYYAIKQDTAPATSRLWLNKTGTKVLKKYTTSWVNVTVKQGDTLTAYDSATKDTSIYLYNSGNWITENENGLVASAEAITNLEADLGSLGNTVSGHTSQLSTIDARIANGVATVDSKWLYNSNLIINGVKYTSGFGLVSTFTGTPNTNNPPAGTSEFWISADKFKLTTTGYGGTKYRPFTVNGTNGEITFNGKVSFTNTTGVPDFATNKALVDSVLVTTFYNPVEPTTGMKYGDYWLDTDSTGYLVYRYQGTLGANTGTLDWAPSNNATAKSLQNAYKAQKVADGKINTYYQATAPTGVLVTGDMWVETDNNYKQYRWSGSAWVALAYNPATAVNAGTTTISGGKITTNSITANKINTTGLIAENISAETIEGKNIDGCVITGALIEGAVIKASWIDFSSTKELSGWKAATDIENNTSIYYTYRNNFAKESDGTFVKTDSNLYYRLPATSSSISNVGSTKTYFGVTGITDTTFYGVKINAYNSYKVTNATRYLTSTANVIISSSVPVSSTGKVILSNFKAQNYNTASTTQARFDFTVLGTTIRFYVRGYRDVQTSPVSHNIWISITDTSGVLIDNIYHKSSNGSLNSYSLSSVFSSVGSGIGLGIETNNILTTREEGSPYYEGVEVRLVCSSAQFTMSGIVANIGDYGRIGTTAIVLPADAVDEYWYTQPAITVRRV